MGLIQMEENDSRKYMLKEDEEEPIVKLTRDNVAKVEAMIHTDSKYRDSVNESKGPKGKYNGSSAYWLKQLKYLIDTEKEKSQEDYEYKEVLKRLIVAIDNENSTHLNSDKGKKGREAVCERIAALDRKILKRYLQNPGREYELIKIIEKPEEEGEKHHFSFATKFCHYVCLYLFKGTEAEDNFSIYDNVVKKALPLYIKKYLKEDVKIKDYENKYYEYISYINRIREAAASKDDGKEISRNGFDHLIWYYHKGRE